MLSFSSGSPLVEAEDCNLNKDDKCPSFIMIMASLLRLLILTSRFVFTALFGLLGPLLFEPYVLYLLRCSGIRFGLSASVRFRASSSRRFATIVRTAAPLQICWTFLAASCRRLTSSTYIRRVTFPLNVAWMVAADWLFNRFLSVNRSR